MSWWSDPATPAWVQAIGSIAAILVAMAVPWGQHRNIASERARQEREHLRRVVVAFREEINASADAAARRQFAITETFEQLAEARKKGAPISAAGPIVAGSLSLTDAVVYRQLASELGRLPSALVKAIVAFYSLTLDLGRVADSAPLALQAYQSLLPSLPRVRMHAAILVRTLEKFEAADLKYGISTNPTAQEIRRFAAEIGYPLDDIAREQGIKLPS